MSNMMKFLYVADNNYAYIAGISILSLLEAHIGLDIEIYLVSDSICSDNLKKLKDICSKYNQRLIVLYYEEIEELIPYKRNSERWSNNIFARLFLASLFEDYKEIDRIIYLDCDTLICKNLIDLWNVDLENNLAAAVNEAMGRFHKKAIGLDNREPYFNSGVILADVKAWRDEGIEEKIRIFLLKARKLEYPDEAAFNHVLQGRIKLLSQQYNMTSLTFYFTVKELKEYRKSAINYTEEERQKALENPSVVHFTSTYMDVRPWVEGSKHPYAKQWLDYKRKSKWSNTTLLMDNRSKKNKLVRTVAMYLPKRIRLCATGFVHAYLKPIKYIRSLQNDSEDFGGDNITSGII